MLNLSGNDVLPFIPVEFGQSLQHHVVAFSRPRGKYDLFGVSTNQARDLISSQFDSFGRVPPEFVRLGVRVAVELGQVGHHGIHDAIVNWRCGLVIKVLDVIHGEQLNWGLPHQGSSPEHQSRILLHLRL